MILSTDGHFFYRRFVVYWQGTATREQPVVFAKRVGWLH